MQPVHLYQRHSDVQLLSTVVFDVDRERNALSDGESPPGNTNANGQRPGLEAARAEHCLLRALALLLQTQTATSPNR